MKRGCQKTKLAPQRARARHCHYWYPAECNPQRTRSRFTPPLYFDPCLGARKPRREHTRQLPESGC